jgi:hypothetical protein
MAASGSSSYVRALALALLALALCAAPAGAQHGGDGTGDDPAAWQEEGWDTAGGDVEQAQPVAPAPVPVDPSVVLPAEPWQPPVAPEPAVPAVPVPTGKTIRGSQALVRADGKAAVPRGAPKRVRTAIAAANQIVGKPYKWGGGHAKLFDRGYDCSGAVGYSLIHASLQLGPMVSGQYAARWGAGGDGRWITVYANKGHVYMEIAGLRLDTSSVGDPAGRNGVRWRPVIGRRPGFKARHVVGL